MTKISGRTTANSLIRFMSDNPGTWHNSYQVKLTSAESCRWTNCKVKHKLENQNPLRSNRASITWEKLCQSHSGKLCQCHFGTIMAILVGNNCGYLGKIVPVTLGNNCASLTLEKLWQSHFGTVAPFSLRKNRTNLTWEQMCQSH